MVDGREPDHPKIEGNARFQVEDFASGSTTVESLTGYGHSGKSNSQSPNASEGPRDYQKPSASSTLPVDTSPSPAKISNPESIPPPFQAIAHPNRPDSVGPPPIASLSGKGQSGSILPERAVEPQLFKDVSSNRALPQWQHGAEHTAKSSAHSSVESSPNVTKAAESSRSSVFDKWREADLAKSRSSDSKLIAGSSDNTIHKGERSELRRSFSDSGFIGDKVESQTYRMRSDSGHAHSEQPKNSSSDFPLLKQPESTANNASKQSLSDVSPRSVANSGKGLVPNVAENAEQATRVGKVQRIDSSISSDNAGKIGGATKQELGQTLKEPNVASAGIKSGRGLDMPSDSTEKRSFSVKDGEAFSGPHEKCNTPPKPESVQQSKDSVSKLGDSKLVSSNNSNASAGVIGLIHDLKPDFGFVNRLKADKGVFNNQDRGPSVVLTGSGRPEKSPDKLASSSDKSKRVTEGPEASTKVSWASKFYTGYLFPLKVGNAKTTQVKSELLGNGVSQTSENSSRRPSVRSDTNLPDDHSKGRGAGREGRRSIFQILDGYLSKRNEKAASQPPDSKSSSLDRYLPKSDHHHSPGTLPKGTDSPSKVTSARGATDSSRKATDSQNNSHFKKTGDSSLPAAGKPPGNPRDQSHPYKQNEVAKLPDKISPPKETSPIPAMLAGNYYPESFSIVARKVKVLVRRRPASDCSQVDKPQSTKLKLDPLISHRYVVLQGFNSLTRRKRRSGLFRSLALRIGEFAYLTTDLLRRNTTLISSEEPVSHNTGALLKPPDSLEQMPSQLSHAAAVSGGTEIPVPNSDLIPEFLQQMTKALPPIVRLHLPGNSYSNVDWSSNSSQADEKHQAEQTVRARNTGFNTSLQDKSLIEQATSVAGDAKIEAGSPWGAKREEPADAGVNSKIDLGLTESENSGWGAVGGGASSMTEKWQKTRASRELAESSRQNAEHIPNAKDKQKPPDCAANEKDNIGYSNRLSRDSIGQISIFEEDFDEPQDSTVEMNSIPEIPAIAKINPGLFSSKGRSTRRYTNPNLDDQDETLISAYEDDTEASGSYSSGGTGNGANGRACDGDDDGDCDGSVVENGNANNVKEKSNSYAGVEERARAVRVSSGEPGFTNCLYIVREGETVESIASDLLKDLLLAPLIFEKNRKHVLPSHDYGVHPLKAGATIELPTASEREKFYASRRKER